MTAICTEAVYNMMEGLIPDYTMLGYVREASGTTVSGIVPTNSHVCKDVVCMTTCPCTYFAHPIKGWL
eukprot:946674-Amphidinium_carterae.1